MLGGASYGAGIALFTVVEYPGLFGGLLLESPSIYAGDYRILKDAESLRVWPHRIFIGTGTVNEPVDDVKRLKKLLQESGLGPKRLQVIVQQGAGHSEKWWAGRFPDALRFLFGTTDYLPGSKLQIGQVGVVPRARLSSQSTFIQSLLDIVPGFNLESIGQAPAQP